MLGDDLESVILRRVQRRHHGSWLWRASLLIALWGDDAFEGSSPRRPPGRWCGRTSRIEAPPDPSARWPGRTLLVCKACFLRLLTGALTSSRRSSSGCRARDQAIIKPQSIEIFDSLISPSQGLFLGLLKKCGSFFVQLFDALDRCFVCHLNRSLFAQRSICPWVTENPGPLSLATRRDGLRAHPLLLLDRQEAGVEHHRRPHPRPLELGYIPTPLLTH